MINRATYKLPQRSDMLHFADSFGKAIKSLDRPQPWCVQLNGDAQSGKSLIPLGVDKVFNPHLYPAGVTEEINADDMKHDGTVFFFNFCHWIEETKVGFDKLLRRNEGEYPEARVLIFGNVMRGMSDHFLCASEEFHSERLDVYLRVVQPFSSETRELTVVTPYAQFLPELDRQMSL